MNKFEEFTQMILEADEDYDYGEELPPNRGEYRVVVQLVDASTDEVVDQMRHKISGSEFVATVWTEIHKILGGEETENPSYSDPSPNSY